MPDPTRRGLFSFLLAALAWLVGRRAEASPPTATPVPPTAAVPATPFAIQTVGPAVVTSTYDIDGRLIACSSPDVVTYTYGGGWRHA